MRLACGAICALLVLSALPAPALELLDVPLGHWSYEYLERLEVRAGLGASHLSTRPLARGDMADLVLRLREAAHRGDWTPTTIESSELDMLRSEFSEELSARGDTVAVLQRAYHVWERPGWKLQAFWRARQRIEHQRRDPAELPQTDIRLVFEPGAALQIGAHVLAAQEISYRVRTGDGSFRNTADVRDGEAEYVFDPHDRFTIMRTDAPYLRYGSGRWRLDLGRARLRWGPGRHNAMLLDDATPPFDQVRLQARFGPVHFTSVAAELRPSQLLPSDPLLRERYLAAHRLEVAVHERLTVALSEALVFGDRGFDLGYLNPLTVLFVTQANEGDRDNAIASADGKLLLPHGLELHGELALDDLNLRRGLRNYGNKVAVLAGFLWLEPFGARDWDLEAEWSWASQFTYTHLIPINRYEHFGGSLGSRTGPDSDLWWVGLRRRLSRGWAAQLFYELERHGEGSLAVAHDQRTSDQQEYLSGTVESRHQPGLRLDYRGLRNLELHLDYRFVDIRHPEHAARSAAQSTHQLHFETRLEF
jgi:hypothetical protein